VKLQFLLPLVLFTTLIISQAGSTPPLQFHTWGGLGQNIANGVALDATGDLFATGYTSSLGPGGANGFLLKYDSNGVLSRQETWGTPFSDVSTGITVDSSGNLYLSGYSSYNSSSYAVLLKVDSNGSLLWQKTWGSNLSLKENSVKTDKSGYILVTGQYGSGVLLTKFDSLGNLVWQRRWKSNSTNLESTGFGVAVDHENNTYVTGDTNGGGNGLLLKFNETGSLQWARSITYLSANHSTAVGLDSAGNVYIAGNGCYFDCNLFSADILKLSSNGTMIWAREWNFPTPTYGGPVATGISVDAAGNAWVTGGEGGVPGYVFMLEIDSNGKLLAHQGWGSSTGDTYGESIALSSDGIPAVAGTTGLPPYSYVTQGSLSNSTISMTVLAGVVDDPAYNFSNLTVTITNVNSQTNGGGRGEGIAFVTYGRTFSVPVLNPNGILAISIFLIIIIGRHTRKNAFHQHTDLRDRPNFAISTA
jgi:hypothetical protein